MTGNFYRESEKGKLLRELKSALVNLTVFEIRISFQVTELALAKLSNADTSRDDITLRFCSQKFFIKANLRSDSEEEDLTERRGKLPKILGLIVRNVSIEEDFRLVLYFDENISLHVLIDKSCHPLDSPSWIIWDAGDSSNVFGLLDCWYVGCDEENFFGNLEKQLL